GVIPLSWSLDHCGPMTRTVEDAAIMLQVIAGHDPKDPTTSRTPVPDYSKALKDGVRGITIGVPRHYFFNTEKDADPETIAIVDEALAQLEKLGARVEEVSIPSLEYASTANNVIMLSEAFAYHRKNLKSQPQNFGEIVRTRFYLGGLFTGADYVQAQRARSRVAKEFAETLRNVDVIVAPSAPRPAGVIEGFDPFASVMRPSFTAPFNQSGMPAISIPCGFDGSGLPIGLQIAGRPFDESMVLRVAYTYQQQARWHEKHPQLG
ncbi:MAG: amidase, partial [Dehalococcoidia bacterium]